jgi:hypothetical protein
LARVGILSHGLVSIFRPSGPISRPIKPKRLLAAIA